MMKIAYIELLDNNQAIAFYEWGRPNEEYFATKDYKIGWSFSSLKENFTNYTDILYGIIVDSQIETILITKEGEQYPANIVEYDHGKRFWFLITDGIELLDSTVTARSHQGQIIEQIPR
ncbi:hypothetical protein BVG16_21215 [Paenibacillus selenitireducens]|uniref:Uncharacterized protein n=1 Tax=Paenibacillus selenitireducens TaxID=1324314 RepID=A0A1T2X5F4_9BACL|nr:hypothetical protein [Paenibacillus selenitireducens]OPA75131.1 hypothetical protein BVG16_21215 [Paenibacillus selenitireducens]